MSNQETKPHGINVYSIDVALYATAYVKARSKEDALMLVQKDLLGRGIELSSGYQPFGGNVCMDGRLYPALAANAEDIALSPAMSINAVDNEGLTLKCVEYVCKLQNSWGESSET